MYIINEEAFDKLSPEDQQIVTSEGKMVSDEAKVSEIEAIASEGGELDANAKLNDENNLDDVTYGDEGEYANTMDKEGNIADMPESAKNSIKDFDTAHTRGNALIRAMSEKKDKVEKIPMNKNAPEDKKVTY